MIRILTLMFLLLAGAAQAASPSPVGLWRTFDDRTGRERGLVRITQVGEELRGTIAGTVDPAEGRHICEKCTDDRRNQPIIGLEIMRGMRPDGDAWDEGRILDPETGKVYHCKMHLEEGGQRLVLRGYIGFSFIGRSQTWIRAG
jgi:uncharacterized protein (DUF2147 family)